MKKVGRNELCLCGSGKKYKKCCLQNAEADESFYRRLGKAQQEINDKIMKFVSTDLGKKVLEEGFNDFFLGYVDVEEDDDADDMLKEFGPIFWPWLFFNWELNTQDLADLELESLLSPHTTLLELYIQTKKPKLGEMEQALASSVNRNPYTFLEVDRVWQNRGFQATDLLSAKEYYITDHTASTMLETEDIIFANPTQIKGYTYLPGCSPIRIPQTYKPYIIDIRERIKESNEEITRQTLLDNELEIMESHLEIYFSLSSSPSMSNMDEEPLSFRSLRFEIDSPESAFEALYPMCGIESRENLLSGAEFDEQGQLIRVDLSWSRKDSRNSNPVDDIILGHIHIDNQTLVVEVNSQVREEIVKEEIEARLGNEARYETTVTESPESIPEDSTGNNPGDPDSENLMQSPEVQEALANKIRDYYLGWMDTQIPALGNETPRQAARTSQGREKVEALLRDLDDSPPSPGLEETMKKIVQEIREELGLMQ